MLSALAKSGTRLRHCPRPHQGVTGRRVAVNVEKAAIFSRAATAGLANIERQDMLDVMSHLVDPQLDGDVRGGVDDKSVRTASLIYRFDCRVLPPSAR